MKLAMACAAMCAAVLSAGTVVGQMSGDPVRPGDVRGTGTGVTLDINNNQVSRTVNAQQQTLEGQIVDLHTATRQIAMSSGAGAKSGTSGAGMDRTDTGSPGLTPGGDKNRAGTPSGNTGSVTSGSGNTNPSPPAAGTSGTNATGGTAGMGGAGSTSDNAGMGGASATSGTLTLDMNKLDRDAIKKNLNAGVPAAIFANGQLYTLIVEPKQLSGHIGQTVRVTGTVLPQQHLVMPDRLEMRGDNGQYREVALTKPEGSRTSGTAGER